tara:strand:+ start:3900 stop:4019 length:120 start_codon:yes stop_codon:yes gene_type:complete
MLRVNFSTISGRTEIPVIDTPAERLGVEHEAGAVPGVIA